MFTKELLTNRALREQSSAFHPPYPERIGDFWNGEQVPTGALVQEDGSVLFRLYAPGMDRARAELAEGKRIVILKSRRQAERFLEGL